MILNQDMWYVVEEDGQSPNDREGLNDPNYALFVEVVTDASGSASLRYVQVPEAQRDTWLDPNAVGGSKCIKRAPGRTSKSEKDASSAPVRLRSSPHTSYSEQSGFIVRVEGHNERVVDTASMISTNRSNTTTCAIMRVLKTSSKDVILQRVKELQHSIWHPCILASLQIERRIPHIKNSLIDHKDNIERMEISAGVYKVYMLHPDERREEGMIEPWKTADFDLLRSELASVKNDLAYQKYKCNIFIDLIAFLDGVAGKMDVLMQYEAKSRYLRTVILGYKERAQYLSDRAETTMQTARIFRVCREMFNFAPDNLQCFSLMAEKDNYLNHRTAAQSLELTNLSRKDNEYMKDIATATYRHSRDMRAITIITLSFLPATFVAAFFSTSFFDFRVGGEMASKWLWMYWVITAVLTATVLGGWHFFSGIFGEGHSRMNPKAKNKDVNPTHIE
ncbi:uncharacterized protein BDR25DRAFT_378969 [Lindgomyces ingoldianus]|uniref:Uncharacterized protein n=1 Tax=Lindgomyces ingoldianus TaxID=673940 RepID=A0ACB6QG28_9PLEO|nr:uncharacterized protein BDR25DRAFT_378969 [Lindgomyces ingoldianus]KAF2465312.1 hypothetical protein BDR25DRAFT_378969 [Lindgomyces ingoldianus]